MDKKNVKQFFNDCSNKEITLSKVANYLKDKSEDQIEELKLELQKEKGRRETWMPFLGIFPVFVSSLSLIVSAADGLSIKNYSPVLLSIFLVGSMIIYCAVAILVGDKTKYENALRYIDAVLVRKEKLEKKKKEGSRKKDKSKKKSHK